MKTAAFAVLLIWSLCCVQRALADQIISQSPSLYTNTAYTNSAAASYSPHSPVRITPPKAEPASARTNAVISFNLKATPIAPAGAAGSGQLKANLLTLHLTRLGPGSYELEAIRRADGTGEKVGTLTIVDPTASPDRNATDNKKEASASPDQVRVDTDAQVTLPDEVAKESISRLVLMDRGGNAVLVGDAE